MTFETTVWTANETFRATIRVNRIEDVCEMKLFQWHDVEIQTYSEGIFEPIPGRFLTEGLEQEILERINQ